MCFSIKIEPAIEVEKLQNMTESELYTPTPFLHQWQKSNMSCSKMVLNSASPGPHLPKKAWHLPPTKCSEQMYEWIVGFHSLDLPPTRSALRIAVIHLSLLTGSAGKRYNILVSPVANPYAHPIAHQLFTIAELVQLCPAALLIVGKKCPKRAWNQPTPGAPQTQLHNLKMASSVAHRFLPPKQTASWCVTSRE